MAESRRRPLHFTSLDEVMPDVERLLIGHTTVGRWSLAQICSHLAMAVNYSVDGYPGLGPWVLRRTIGPWAVRRTFRTGRVPQGLPLPRKYHPQPGSEARTEAEALRAALARFTAHIGPPVEHPFGGRLTRADWHRFHAVHCAHHLSFTQYGS